jgi:hypothetical protein
MTFRRRSDIPRSDWRGPDRVHIRVTPDRASGVRLLEAGHLSLTCPLGADPVVFEAARQWNCVSNDAVNLGMILRPYPQSTLAEDFESLAVLSGSMDREAPSRASAGTLVSMESIAALFAAQPVGKKSMAVPRCSYSNARKIELRYAAYQPNLQLASAIRDQLHRNMGIHCVLVETSYRDYVERVFPRVAGLSLEIIQPGLPFDQMSRLWQFVGDAPPREKRPISPSARQGVSAPSIAIPILQCMSTAMSRDQSYETKRPVTCEALVDWEQL